MTAGEMQALIEGTATIVAGAMANRSVDPTNAQERTGIAKLAAEVYKSLRDAVNEGR